MAGFSTLYIASDHGGFATKQAIIDHLATQNIAVQDLGPDTTESVDYPDYAGKLAKALEADSAAGGFLICGSGIGISIEANRYHSVRAALVHDATGARLCREHNNANVLVLGERLTGLSTVLDCVDRFLATDFEGGRHERRVAKLGAAD